ncbi:MAG: VWA domain-containing protein [Chloroflexi bacterium]|nr:MAG: VWA domain-containing protein [Chloroflexota bacterium]
MSRASDLSLRYATELKGYGASLPDDFLTAATALESQLSAEELDAWAQSGIDLAASSLRAWEAAAEYFRASPSVAERLGPEGLKTWSIIAGALSQRSSLMAAAFLKSTPAVLESIGVHDLEAWSEQGDRLCRGNWKSIALSSLYFQVSPALLRTLPLDSVGRIVDIVDQLTERSYELATTCMETAPTIFESLPVPDREPFLRFARAVARASWADIRLYFERGPKLIEGVAPLQRARYLDLSARVTSEVGRQGFPLFSDAAQAMSSMPYDLHGGLLTFAERLSVGSPSAAMEYLKSAPFVSSRLNETQMARWAEAGANILNEEHNPEGADAYFRLESARAEDMLASLSARVELANVHQLLRMYAQALAGTAVAVQSAEALVDRNIGWVTESGATTEGDAIYLPPFVATFEDQEANFQVYKVFTTHQTGRMEFGSFVYEFGRDGIHAPNTAEGREVRAEAARVARAAEAGVEMKEAIAPATAMQRYFNMFDDRSLILGLFTIAEDTRIDARTGIEYGGIRRALRELQEHEAHHRPPIELMGMRQAYMENLLRSSLGVPDTMRWPVSLNEYLRRGIAALKVVELPDASVQDSAEVAAAIYDIALAIPNVPEGFADGKFEPVGEDMMSIAPGMPGESEGNSSSNMPGGEEMEFENPPQPEFRGDFKPELVQLMSKLKAQKDGDDGPNAPLTKEQLMELLQNSAEIEIGDWSEGDLDASLGAFLDNIEQEAQKPTGDQQPSDQTEGGDTPDGGKGDGGESDLKPEIDWFYYDEWDFRASDYRPRWTRVGERFSDEGDGEFYQETLRKYHGLVMETRRQFEMMRPESFKKIKRLEDGEELDLDLAIEFHVDKKAGVGPQARIYSRRNKVERDVAVAFLLDMSASTDEEIEKQRQKYDPNDQDDFDGDPRKYFQWLAARRAKNAIEPPKRIIDLEKESTVLIVEALEAIGDSYGIFGFSGYGRDNVEFHVIKNLDEQMSERIHRRIDKIEPIRSTRMGPAIRHTIHKLDEFDAKVKILILVSDGRPQDHGYGRDRTEKEYAVHDTKQALLEAKRKGITPFLITVDKEGHDYLKQMCDDIGYEVVDDLETLPRRLPTLYRHLASE